MLHCAGPGRRKLKLKDAEHYHWRPKELLASICDIYVHLGRADSQGVFAAAIADDGRCYRPEMFPEAAQVLSSPPDSNASELMAMMCSHMCALSCTGTHPGSDP